MGTRAPVSPMMMLAHRREYFGIMEDRASVCRTTLNDFIVRFSSSEDLKRVLRAPSAVRGPFMLQWHRWNCLINGSKGAFCYRVLVGMKGIPSQACSSETACAILGSSSVKVDITDPDAPSDLDDERELFVVAWCAHPDLILDEKIMAVPEPEEEHDGGSLMYLRPHEIIHGEVPMLRYLVRRWIVEF